MGRSENSHSIKSTLMAFLVYFFNGSNFYLQRKLRQLQKPSEPRVSDDEKMDLSLRHDETTTAAPALPPTIAEKLPEVRLRQ